MKNDCYVYSYRVDRELWIIGKGHGRRDQKHLARAKRYAKGLPMHRIYGWQRDLGERIRAGSTIVIERLAENLTTTKARFVAVEANVNDLFRRRFSIGLQASFRSR